MVLPLDLHHMNPCRPPDWRWLRSVGIADENQQRPSRRRDGDENMLLIRRAASFRREFLQAAQSPDPLAQFSLVEKYPELSWAHQLYTNGNQIQSRYAVEARILGKQNDREIAFSIGSTEGVVKVYENLFFSVRERLENSDYIFQVVIGKELHGSLSTLDYGLLWKLFAYLGGPHVLEAIMRRVANPSWVSRSQEVLSFFHDTAVGTMKQRASIAAATIPVNSHTNLPILEAFVRYVEVERTTDGVGQAENQMLGNLAEMLSSLPISIGTHQNAIASRGSTVFDTSAVELRGDELMALSSGGVLPDQEKLLELTYPVINQEG
jgi:hypothetical protein